MNQGAFIHSFTHSLTHSLTYSLTHPLTHSLTHSHSLTCEGEIPLCLATDLVNLEKLLLVSNEFEGSVGVCVDDADDGDGGGDGGDGGKDD